MSPESNTMSYLIELRQRLLRVVLMVVCLFVGLFYFSNPLYHWVAQPLLHHLPQGQSMIAIGVATAFFTPLKLALFCAILLALPVMFYELWRFISPGLYAHEKRYIWPLLILSTILFFVGMAFAYYVVFPLMFHFLIHTMPQDIKVMPDMAHYLDLVLKLFFAFGCAFEVPVLVVVLIATGVFSAQQFSQARPYIIVLAFTLGMLLTPPDVLSQILLAIPLWFLFELGLFVGRFVSKKSHSV